MLFAPLALSAALVLATIVIQIVGLVVLIWIMRRRASRFAGFSYVIQQLGVILAVVMGLFLIHAFQIWLYAAVYLALNEFESFEAALYFSTSSFTTVGYGEIFIESRWRIVAAIQSANGFLLLGWSTIFLLSVLTRLRSVEIDWLESRLEPELFNHQRGEKDKP
ncbi:potassium channel family protein [Maricaulaceae bacterium EIL42A08]|nr:potassium channel family protein [Maricaulaceae bacterium EIL42A08]